jgi:hypothetical protein
MLFGARSWVTHTARATCLIGILCFGVLAPAKATDTEARRDVLLRNYG